MRDYLNRFYSLHKHPMFKTLLKKATTATGMIVALAIVLFIGVAISTHASAEESPDVLMRQAQEAKLKAAKARCKQIGQLTALSYTQDESATKQLQDNIALFTKDFGFTPEIACTKPERFLGAGDRK